ncbi:hypothetical protein [Haloferax denitrificans]|nr:hypothetical protein [Haloferax denitrificans]
MSLPDTTTQTATFSDAPTRADEMHDALDDWITDLLAESPPN